MMISPETYIDMIEDKSYENLVKERNKLIKEIHHFEEQKEVKSEIIIDPSPDVIYQCNNMYLVEVTKLLDDKFNELINDTQLLNDCEYNKEDK